MKYWSKSAITIYRYLETMANSIDKIIMDTGKNSNSKILQKYQTTYYQAGKILELIDRKRKIINLKVAIEESLADLTKTDRRLLTLVYIDGVKSELVSELLGVSIRTFFRKKTIALVNFAKMLQKNGYDIEFFERDYQTEKWIASVYYDCVSKLQKSEEDFDSTILKKILSEVAKINFSYNTYI